MVFISHRALNLLTPHKLNQKIITILISSEVFYISLQRIYNQAPASALSETV